MRHFRENVGAYQVRIFDLFCHRDVLQFYVQILIDRPQDTADLDIVLELDCNLLIDESLEEAAREEVLIAKFAICIIRTCTTARTYLKKSIVYRDDLRQYIPSFLPALLDNVV